ncbi:hypothetical protein MPSEU_000824900 [Mayamaea pseudoterrestris]|nr:hypothetical protein MPSEU_000824900 [Mayamaea pseudoterrestris]
MIRTEEVGAINNSLLTTDGDDHITKRLLQSLNERRNRVQRMVEEKKEDVGSTIEETKSEMIDGHSVCESLYFDESVADTRVDKPGESSYSINASSAISIRRLESPTPLYSSNKPKTPTKEEIKQFYKAANVSFGTEITGTTADLTADCISLNNLIVAGKEGKNKQPSLQPSATDKLKSVSKEPDCDSESDEFSFDDCPATFEVASTSSESSCSAEDQSRLDTTDAAKNLNYSDAKREMNVDVDNVDDITAVAQTLERQASGLSHNPRDTAETDRTHMEKEAIKLLHTDNQKLLLPMQSTDCLVTANDDTSAFCSVNAHGQTTQDIYVAGAANNSTMDSKSSPVPAWCGVVVEQGNHEQYADTNRKLTAMAKHQLVCDQVQPILREQETSTRTFDTCKHQSQSLDHTKSIHDMPSQTVPGRNLQSRGEVNNGLTANIPDQSPLDDGVSCFVEHSGKQKAHSRSHSYDASLDRSDFIRRAGRRRARSLDPTLLMSHTGRNESLIQREQRQIVVGTLTTPTTRPVTPDCHLNRPTERGTGDVNCDASTCSSRGCRSDDGRAVYIGDLYSSERSKTTSTDISNISSEGSNGNSETSHGATFKKARVVVQDSDGEELSLSLIVSEDSSVDFTTDSNTSGWMTEEEFDRIAMRYPKEVCHDIDAEFSDVSGEVGDSLLGDLDALLDEPSLLGSCYSFEEIGKHENAADMTRNKVKDNTLTPAHAVQEDEVDAHDLLPETRWVIVERLKKAKLSTQHVTWDLPKLQPTSPIISRALFATEEEADENCGVNRGLYAVAMRSGLRLDGPFDIKLTSTTALPMQALRLSTDFRCGAQGSLYDIAVQSGFDLSQPWIWKKQKQKKFIPARGGLWYISGLNKKMLRSRKPFTLTTNPPSLDDDDDATVLPEDITDYECGANGNLFLAFETAGGDYTCSGSLYYLATYSNKS